MIDLTIESIMDEVQASETLRNEHMEWHEAVSRLTGPGYRPNSSRETHVDLENHAFEWVSLVVPQLTFGNPRVKVGTSRVGSQRDVARAIEFALNRWAKDSKMRRLNEKLGIDFGMKWGVAITLPGYSDGFSEAEDPKGWPSSKRISPRTFIWDHLATEMENARFMGHLVIRDKKDLLKEAEEDPDAGWNLDMLRTLEDESSLEEYRGEQRDDSHPKRGEIAYYEIWVPEYTGNEDLDKYDLEIVDEEYQPGAHNGLWLTVAVGQSKDGSGLKGAYLRKARRYWGPRAGPYTWIGCYTVPDLAAPLGPIPAVSAQARELNGHAAVLSRAMAMYKRLTIIEAADGSLAEKIKDARDEFVLAIQGAEDINKKVVQVELGGATDMHITHNGLLRERLDRNSGIHEISRGNVGNATATAASIADEATTIRLQFMTQKFRDGVQNILEKVAWYLYHDDDIDFALGEEAQGQFVSLMTGEPIEEAWFHGGLFEEQSGADFDSLGLEIEPYSMERTSEAMQQRRMAELDQTMVGVVPMMAQFPFVDWGEYLQMRGEFMNVPNLAKLIDVDQAKQVAMQMMQIQLDPESQGTSKPQPRTGRDIGKLRNGTPGSERGSMAGVNAGVDIGSAGKRV